jgi:hypothetical protein
MAWPTCSSLRVRGHPPSGQPRLHVHTSFHVCWWLALHVHTSLLVRWGPELGGDTVLCVCTPGDLLLRYVLMTCSACAHPTDGCAERGARAQRGPGLHCPRPHRQPVSPCQAPHHALHRDTASVLQAAERPRVGERSHALEEHSLSKTSIPLRKHNKSTKVSR